MNKFLLTATQKETVWTLTGRIREVLFSIFFFFMPFTQALTFKIGFPLKISEVALLLLSLFYLFSGKKVAIPRALIYILGLLFFLVTASFLINLFWEYPYPLKEFPTRFGYTGDSVTRYIYFVLAVLAFFISVDIFSSNLQKYIRIWLAGAIVAACYSWYLAGFSYFKLPVYLLPGMEDPPQTVDGIIRCGTFLEGNYMGLYLLVSAAMAFYIRKYWTGAFLLLSIITTLSTLTILSVGLFLLIHFKNYIFNRKTLPLFGILVLLFIAALPIIMRTDFYREFIHEKIFSDVSKVNSNAAYSKADRLVTIKTGISMAKGNPVWGVGLSNYSRHYDHFYSAEGMEKKLYEIFKRNNAKAIANNIYVEVLSETGVLAFLLYLSLLICLLYYAWPGRGSITLAPGLLCMMLCFMAYPSFIMVYLWCFLALPGVHYKNHLNANKP